MTLTDDNLGHLTPTVLVFLDKFKVETLCHCRVQNPESLLGESLAKTDTFSTVEGDM